MAFTMSYGVVPPAAAKPAPAATPAKPRAPARVRKVSTAQAQAEALFDPAQARTAEPEAEPA